MTEKLNQLDFDAILQTHNAAVASVFVQKEKLQQLVHSVIRCLEQGGKVLWCGNGGSAADAQHMAAELMVRYVNNRRPLASIALTTDSSILTAHSNDYSFDTVFARQVEGLARAQDVLISLSTSGRSSNVLLAQQQAKQMGVFCVALIGQELTELGQEADLCFTIDACQTARIQEAHTLINHVLCEGLDHYFSE